MYSLQSIKKKKEKELTIHEVNCKMLRLTDRKNMDLLKFCISIWVLMD